MITGNVAKFLYGIISPLLEPVKAHVTNIHGYQGRFSITLNEEIVAKLLEKALLDLFAIAKEIPLTFELAIEPEYLDCFNVVVIAKSNSTA